MWITQNILYVFQCELVDQTDLRIDCASFT